MTRLLFFDIDGTLIADNHQVPSSLVPALKKAKANGCLLFINTGRTLCNMDPRLKEIPLDGMVTGCGSRIICQGKTLRAVEYAPADSLRIRDVFLARGIPVVYECDTGMYFDPEGPSWPAITYFRAFSDRAGLTRTVSGTDPEFRAVKMFGFSETFAPVRALLDALAREGYPYEAIDRGEAGWEIVPGGCSKAAGIEMVRTALGVPLENCYAFGDSNNDRSMLEFVPNSVAMGNAPEELKRLCRHVAPRPEEDGVARVLADLGLA